MCRLMKRILGYLIPTRAIVGVPLREVEYGDGHQLADEDLFIVADTKAFMRSAELPVSAEKKIFQTVRSFYEAVHKKMFSSFPLDHPLLRDLKVLDPAARLNITPGTVERLGALRLKEDKMREEFKDYQVTDSKQLPQEDRIDRFWGLVGKDVRLVLQQHTVRMWFDVETELRQDFRLTRTAMHSLQRLLQREQDHGWDEDILMDDPQPPREHMAYNETSGNDTRNRLAALVSDNVQAP
ncbi:uncharacterized protein LOC116045763 [Sander lucioperca]|uniref:uncharacterized protein LOC116045763 n=1 Tax=Sander lucioperca TaxID=283035 RepID=UPI00125DE3BC|nr:uncharacterized protein LOC116045763 [Sander lucioperca]